MNRLTDAIAAIAIALTVSGFVAGCSATPFLSALGTGQHIPANGIVLAPNEKITLNANTANRMQYFCSSKTALRCERLGANLYCVCPGVIFPR